MIDNLSNEDILRSLRVGDVVRARHGAWGEGAYIEGPIHRFRRYDNDDSPLYLGGINLRPEYGDWSPWTLKVISRVKPFYVNADRVVPIVGDVATTTYSHRDPHVGPWFYTAKGWVSRSGTPIVDPFGGMPAGRCVLVYDGASGTPLPKWTPDR